MNSTNTRLTEEMEEMGREDKGGRGRKWEGEGRGRGGEGGRRKDGGAMEQCFTAYSTG